MKVALTCEDDPMEQNVYHHLVCATELIFCINPKSNRLFVCLLFNANFSVTSRQLQPFIDSKILPQSSLQGIISFHKRKNMKYTLNSWHQHQEPQIETKHKTVKNNLNILFHLILSYLILSYLILYYLISNCTLLHLIPYFLTLTQLYLFLILTRL